MTAGWRSEARARMAMDDTVTAIGAPLGAYLRRALDALDAVLALHTRDDMIDPETGQHWCSFCGPLTDWWATDSLWPCPTVRAIQGDETAESA